MKPETERLLGTLEILARTPFIWETEKNGEMNLWNLMLSEGFIKETDLELVFNHWQNIERWGTPTSQIDGQYAPAREEREDNDWNEAIAKQRQRDYQQLQQFCQKNLQNLKAYHLRVDESVRYLPNFYISIIIGKTLKNNWICLAPIVEDLCLGIRPQTEKNTIAKSANQIDDSILSKIDSYLNKITPITIYGYYDGGYNQTHQHQIVQGISTNNIDAIALALQTSGMVTWELTQVEYAGNYNNSRKLSQFMNQCLQDRTYCQISFWDYGYSYEFGRTPANDWIGTKFSTEFDYNP
ncbi:MAG: hypothetical protein AAGF26_02780 [Cyanobacteria bacterium P01_G01_bin.49]